jgi:Zn-dependent protease
VGARGLAINLFLAAFNLIPFGGIDGKTVLGWSKVVWTVTFLPTAAAAVFVVFVLGIGFT